MKFLENSCRLLTQQIVNQLVMIVKTCPRCKITKEKMMFHKSKTRVDRMAVYCIACEKQWKKKKAEDRKYADLYGIV
jgi:ssDNA-binding Zn-finger/Zn-ribbon topoisomerase 1